MGSYSFSYLFNGVAVDVERLHLRGDMGSYLDLEDGHSIPAADYLAGDEVNFSLAETKQLKYLDLSGIIHPQIGNLSNLKVRLLQRPTSWLFSKHDISRIPRSLMP